MIEPALYKEVFEDDRRGAAILEDLIARFGAMRAGSSGIDRVLDTQEYVGKRKVLEYIARRINQANGVEPIEGEPDE